MKNENAKRVGFIAESHTGRTIYLTDPKKHPRGQLLEQLGETHADKMYVDGKDGEPKHIGYIVNGEWFNIYAIHEWNG